MAFITEEMQLDSILLLPESILVAFFQGKMEFSENGVAETLGILMAVSIHFRIQWNERSSFYCLDFLILAILLVNSSFVSPVRRV